MPIDNETQQLIREAYSVAPDEESRQRVIGFAQRAGVSLPVPSNNFDFENNLKAIAEGALRGATFGAYGGPEWLRTEGKVWEGDVPVLSDIPGIGELFKNVSPARAIGELAGSYGGLGAGIKIGGRLLGAAASPLLREIAGASLMRLAGTGAEATTQLLSGKDVDWKSVGEQEAYNLAIGAALQGTAHVTLPFISKGIEGVSKGIEGVGNWLKEVPKEGLEKIAKGAEVIALGPPALPRPETGELVSAGQQVLNDVFRQRAAGMRLTTIPENLAKKIDNYAKTQKFSTDDILDRAMMFTEKGKNITDESVDKAVRWLKVDAKSKIDLIEEVIKKKAKEQAEATIPEEMRSAIQAQTGAESQMAQGFLQQPQRLAIPEQASMSRGGPMTPLYLETGSPTPGYPPIELTEKSTQLTRPELTTHPSFIEESKGHEKYIQDIRDLNQQFYRKDANLIERVQSDLKAGIQPPQAVMDVYNEARRRMMGSEATSLSEYPVSGFPEMGKIQAPKEGTLRLKKLKSPVK